MSANKQTKSDALKPQHIDLSKITFGEIVTNKHGGKSCRVQLDGRDLMIETPRMKLPYGISVNIEKDTSGKPIQGKNPKYNLDLSFAGFELNDQGEPADKAVRELFEKMEGLHNLLIKAVHKNAESWLGLSECNEAIAKAFVRDTIKYSKDKITKKINNKYAPTLRGKLAFWDNKFSALAYDENKQLIPDLKSALVARGEARTILKLEGVNIAQGKCGFSFKIIQIRVYRPVGLPAYAFVDDDDEDVPVKSTLTSEPEQKSHNTHVEDSEDDENGNGKDELDAQDDDEEDEEKPPTPPPQTKKIVKTASATKAPAKKK